MPDQTTGYINHVRLIIKAIKDGRITAHDVDGMTDEQIDQFIEHEQARAQAAVDRGRELDNQQ